MIGNLKKSFWLNSLFFTLMQRFSLIIFGLIGNMVLFRFFGREKDVMGIWIIFFTITTMIETIKQGLLRNATIKFYHLNEFADNRREVQSASLAVNVLFALLVVVLILFFGGWLSTALKTPELNSLLHLGIVIILFQVPFNHCEIVQQANMKYQPIFWAYFMRQGLFFLGMMILAIFFRDQLKIINLVYLQIFSITSASIFFIWKTRKLLYGRFSFHAKIIGRLLSFGKYVFGTSFFSNLAGYTDHFITAGAIGNPELGKIYVSYYNVKAKVFSLMDVPSVAAADVLFPKSAQASELEGDDKVRYYFERMVGTLMALLIPPALFILLFPKLIVLIIAGRQYMEAVPILMINIVFAVVRPVSYQFGLTMDSIGKPQVNFWFNMLFLTINISSTYVGLHYIDLKMGPAYAGIFVNTICTVIMYLVMRKMLGVRVRHIVAYIAMAYRDAFNLVKKVAARA